LAVNLVNFALSAWASFPFARAKEALSSPEEAGGLAGAAGAGFDDAGFDEEAPVEAIRASLSAAVVQVMLVPALRTKGSAAQIVPSPHGVTTNLS